ncbi:MAG: HAD-IA family hydrolase [Candidatus Babeliaceae bacterium]|nr:HAD-IA family hydrolase [Candidatus Babeliaceae bacterium]
MNMIRCNKSIFALATLVFLGGSFPFLLQSRANGIKAIVFDVGGVLIDFPRSGAVKRLTRELGIGGLIGQAFRGNLSGVSSRVFEVMEKIGGKQVPEAGCKCACGNGSELPHLFCLWQAGLITSDELREIIEKELDEQPEKYLRNNSEKRLLRAIFDIVLDPAACAQSIAKGVALLRDCVGCMGEGRVFLLSNFDREGFTDLRTNPACASIFELLNPANFFVSGFVGALNTDGTVKNIKPYRSIYCSFCEKYNLKPYEVLFIDDQPENICGAREAGMLAMHLENGNYDEVREVLEKLGVLSDGDDSGSSVARGLARMPAAQ